MREGRHRTCRGNHRIHLVKQGQPVAGNFRLLQMGACHILCIIFQTAFYIINHKWPKLVFMLAQLFDMGCDKIYPAQHFKSIISIGEIRLAGLGVGTLFL